MGNSMLKLGRPVGRLNFNMELPIPVGRNPNIATPPRYQIMTFAAMTHERIVVLFNLMEMRFYY